MALWQFTIGFIPSSWAKENDFNASFLYDEDGYNTEISWKGRQPDKNYKRIFEGILPTTKSWCDEILIWGNDKEHDIQVFIENDEIEDISFRLDLNQNINDIVIKLVQAAKLLDCVLFFPELEVITEANEFEIKSAIKSSNSFRYVRNPIEFLNGIEK